MHYNTRYIWFICAIAALGGLLFGYDFVVIGGAKPFYEQYFELSSDRLIGWANSCALLGCLAGSLASGLLTGRFGRRKILLLAAFLFAVSSICTGWAHTFNWFVTWRIIGGTAIGLASNVSPMYIAEVSPAEWRGRLVSLNQLTIVVGILAAQVVNWLIARPSPEGATAEMIRLSWNGQYAWRWMFTAVAVPSIIFFACAWFVPESPRWLAQNGARETARRILSRIGGAPYADREMREIVRTVDEEPQGRWADLFAPGLRGIVLMGVLLAVLQQWCGINVIFNYAEEIYRGAGYNVNGILFNIVITGTINLVCTLPAFALVDRFGRRGLMLAGCAGVGTSHALLGLAYHFGMKGLPVLVLTLSTLGCFSMTLGPVAWVLIAEIFPNRVRALAVSISVSALWIACFLLTFTFPLLNSTLGSSGTFWLYASICYAGFLYVFLCVPETKGKSLEQLERQLAPAKYAKGAFNEKQA
jgi:SP family xylose:H+ symportor-like MFS transporter